MVEHHQLGLLRGCLGLSMRGMVILTRKNKCITLPWFNHLVTDGNRYLYLGKDDALIDKKMVHRIRDKILKDCIKNPRKYLDPVNRKI
jgi:hypothetical protein